MQLNLPPFSKAEKKQSMINIGETYNLWDLVNTKYAIIDQLQIWHEYIHDAEFKIIIKKLLSSYHKYTENLEKKLKKYSIAGPDKPAIGVSTSVKPEIITDQRMSLWLFTWIQEEIELLLRAARTSTTNDPVRSLFIQIVTQRIEDMNLIIKYLKFKGWLNQPPVYPNVPVNTKEKIDTAEAYHLWDHLTFRYDNIQQTQIWYEYANDVDFKLLLKKGLQDILKKQTKMLEKELMKFGISLPKRPADVIQTSKDNTILNDDYMYRVLFSGIMGALWLHTLALKQCTTNDRVRGIFKDLLNAEIKALDQIILFGKVKGWLNSAPNFIAVQ